MQVLQHLDSTWTDEGKSDDYVAGVFEARLATAARSNTSLEALRNDSNYNQPTDKQDSAEGKEPLWMRPLAVSLDRRV